MKDLDFHIDEPVLHDAVIEKHMDFNTLMKTVDSAQHKASDLTAVWLITSCTIGLLVLILSLGFDASKNNVLQKKTANITIKKPEKEQHQKSVLAPVLLFESDAFFQDTLDSNSSRLTPVNQEKTNAKSDLSHSVILTNIPKEKVITKPELQDFSNISIPEPVKIKTTKGHLIEVDHKKPSGLPITVDFNTYAELKKSDYYYFEVDGPDGNAEILDTDNWDKGDLSFYPEKDRFKLELVKDGIKKVVVVKLVTGNYKSMTSQKKLFNLNFLKLKRQ